MRRRMFCFWTALLAVLYCCGRFSYSVALLVAGALCIAVSLLAFCKKREGAYQELLFCAVGILVAFLLFVSWETLFYRPSLLLQDEAVSVTGQVARVTEKGEYNEILLRPQTVSGKDAPLVGSIALYAPPNVLPRAGDKISFVGDVRVYQNGTSGFDGERYYKSKGIFLRAYAEKEDIHVQAGGFSIAALLETCADGIAARLEEVLSGDSLFLARALLLGEKSGMPERLSGLFSKGGMAHALAVSGLHVSFLAGLFSLIAAFLPIGYRFKQILIACAVMLFVFMIGCPPSAMRAGLMLALYCIGKACYRDGDRLLLLFSACGFICICNPYAAMDIGLQLSFLSVFGLLTVGMKVQAFLNQKLPGKGLFSKATRYLLSALSTTLCATYFTLPVIAEAFGEISLVSPLTNLLGLPAIFLLMFGALLLAVVGWIPVLAVWIGACMKAVAFYVVTMLEMLTSFDAASACLPVPVALSIFIAIAACVGFIWGCRKKKWVTITAALLFLMVAVYPTANFYLDYRDNVKVSFLQVGQGLCTIISEQDKTAVFDCGSSSSSYAGQTAASALRRDGISEIDWLVLSHGHEDHGNGMFYLMDHFAIGTLVLPEADNSALVAELRNYAAQKNIPIVDVATSYGMPLGETTEILLEMPGKGYLAENDLALTATVTCRGKTILLPSDISAAIEEKWQREGDILLVAHHGSATSSSSLFLEKAQAEYAVISCGGLLYDFPADETVERLEEFCDNILITREDGDILFRIGKEGQLWRKAV